MTATSYTYGSPAQERPWVRGLYSSTYRTTAGASSIKRLIGTIRRQCTDHVIVLNEQHLRRLLRSYVDYYHPSRSHRSLDDNCPLPREVEPPDMGEVMHSRKSAAYTIATAAARRERAANPTELGAATTLELRPPGVAPLGSRFLADSRPPGVRFFQRRRPASG